MWGLLNKYIYILTSRWNTSNRSRTSGSGHFCLLLPETHNALSKWENGSEEYRRISTDMNGWIQFIFHSDVCYVSVLVDSRSLRYVNYIKPIPLSMQRTGPPQYNIWSPIGCSGFKTGSHAPFHPTPKLSALRLSLKPGWFVVRASSKPWAAFGLILNNVNINLLECINRISGLSAVPQSRRICCGL